MNDTEDHGIGPYQLIASRRRKTVRPWHKLPFGSFERPSAEPMDTVRARLMFRRPLAAAARAIPIVVGDGSGR